jgi:peptidoglycan/xylan/chitin deacetylase (PgdA/CDA1 family)
MSLHVRERLQRVPSWLRNRFNPAGLILLYHRVTTLPSDPHLLSITPQQFEEHLQVIKRLGQPVHLRELVKSIKDGRPIKRAIVVTFDDGYADNLLEAKPLLEKYDIPATVYVTSGHIEQKEEFWWDEIDRLLLQPGTPIQETINLQIKGNSYQWNLGASSNYTNDDYLKHRSWHVLKEQLPSTRHQLFCELQKLIRPLPADERNNVLNQLRSFTSIGTNGRSTHRTMTYEEVVKLDKSGIVEVGAHTVNHPVLSALPVEMQRDEIKKSKEQLEEILNRRVDTFAYPFGGRIDYTSDSVEIVKEVGFESACSNFFGVIRGEVSLFELPRMMVGDPRLTTAFWDGERFAKVMRYHAFG